MKALDVDVPLPANRNSTTTMNTPFTNQIETGMTELLGPENLPFLF